MRRKVNPLHPHYLKIGSFRRTARLEPLKVDWWREAIAFVGFKRADALLGSEWCFPRWHAFLPFVVGQADHGSILDSIRVQLPIHLMRGSKGLLVTDASALGREDQPFSVVRVLKMTMLALIVGDPADFSWSASGVQI